MSTAVFIFGIILWVLWQDFWFFNQAITLIKIQNKIERQAVSQQPLSAKAWVHSQVS
jgi:hypothetical protein